MSTSWATSGRPAGTPPSPSPFHHTASYPAIAAAAAAAGPSSSSITPNVTPTVHTGGYGGYDTTGGGAAALVPASAPVHEDVWVTVFGFGPSSADMALVLAEMSKCGDVVRWVPGGGAAGAAANFMHVQVGEGGREREGESC